MQSAAHALSLHDPFPEPRTVAPISNRTAPAPDTPRTPRRRGERHALAVLVLSLHALGLYALTSQFSPPISPPEIQPISISFIPLAAPPAPVVEPPAPPPPEPVKRVEPPKPVKPAPRPPKPLAPVKPPPEPVITESATALSSNAPVAAPAETAPAPAAPPAAPAVESAAPAAAAPVIAARFDADYLNNPAPAYPPLSRRMREEGKVMLRVTVTPDGLPGRIEVARSSGSERLDQAAANAVRQWRFVAARQGDRAIEASVLVPIIFKLEGN